MSVEIILIPMAMAAVAAWQARGEAASAQTCLVGTRMRHRALLAEALELLGAEVSTDATSVRAELADMTLQFTWSEDGIATAHVEGGEIAAAEQLIAAVDQEYAALVQAAVYQRLTERVEHLGLHVESESVQEDNSITLVLALEQT